MGHAKTDHVAINGFGRIGRLFLRSFLKGGNSGNLKVVAINDLTPPENLAYLFKYDSTHGIFPGEVGVEGEDLIIHYEGKIHRIKVLAQREPDKLPWRDLLVDYVVESTGLFTSYEGAHKHLMSGAHKVIISAPVSGSTTQVPTFVMGVNHLNYRPEFDHIISNASCTTNCLAPVVKVIDEHFGLEEGFMSTIHAVTASQPTVDGPSKKDWRGGRGALQNIIPASTGAAKALGLCLPHLNGKITGMSFRVPVGDVSVVDLTFKVKESTSYENICEALKKEAEGKTKGPYNLKGIISVTNELLVSSDFIGSTFSSIVDVEAGLGLNDRFFKMVIWYDNEMGYSNRVVDILRFMNQQDSLKNKN
jgi:glyceraldehyde 3-phosphate dehydrogenase